MARIRILTLMLFGAAVLGGCASAPQHPRTNVDLSRGNFRVVRSNAVGTDTGFKLLGFIPIARATYSDAMFDLYEEANLHPGPAFAVVNVSEERTGIYLVLFSLPRVTVRADVVEFAE